MSVPVPPPHPRTMRHIPLLLLALLPGCFLARSTFNEPLKPEAVARLEPGVTTSAEVMALLGAPTEVVQLGRRSAYRYDATTSKRTGLWLIVVLLSNTDTRSDRVWVFFDEAGLLTHLGSTFDAADPSYGMPWNEWQGD